MIRKEVELGATPILPSMAFNDEITLYCVVHSASSHVAAPECLLVEREMNPPTPALYIIKKPVQCGSVCTK